MDDQARGTAGSYGRRAAPISDDPIVLLTALAAVSTRMPGASTVRPSGVLDLDLDVNAGRKLDPLERVDGLRRRADDVDQPLVDSHLEVLAAVLVLVGRADDREAVLVRR